MIDFVMISVLLVLLLLVVLQVAIFFYARNVVASSAADAARFAASQGQPPGVGAARAADLVHEGLPDADASRIRCTSVPAQDAQSGLAVVTVHCLGRIRVLFSAVTMPLTIDVSSSVLREDQP